MARKSKSLILLIRTFFNWFFLAILIIGLGSGIVLVRRKQLLDQKASTRIVCSTYLSQSTCNSTNVCNWKTVVCDGALSCDSHCQSTPCTWTQCKNNVRGCKLSASSYCMGGGFCSGLNKTDCTKPINIKTYGCVWNQQVCSGVVCSGGSVSYCVNLPIFCQPNSTWCSSDGTKVWSCNSYGTKSYVKTICTSPKKCRPPDAYHNSYYCG